MFSLCPIKYVSCATLISKTVCLMTVSNISRGIRVGVIGIKGMGWSNLQSILKISDVTCTAICDIDDEVLRQRLDELKQRNIHPQPYKDYKQLLAASDVDAVIIATPDHWHCLQATEARSEEHTSELQSRENLVC